MEHKRKERLEKIGFYRPESNDIDKSIPYSDFVIKMVLDDYVKDEDSLFKKFYD